MQRVVHEYRNKSRVFNMIEGLYSYLTDYDAFEDILWLDETFRPLCEIIGSQFFEFRQPSIRTMDLPRIPCPKCDTEEVTVCLSGGKDSVACAYYFKKRGYKVHLYHAAGINKAYGDEKKAATAIAKYLGCDLFIEKFDLRGTHPFVEHPLKNYIIANGALHYCLAKGYSPNLAFGNFNQSFLADNVFVVCGGDCIEMWNAYSTIIQKVLPEFTMQIPLRTNADTFDLLSEDWQLFKLAVSCMSPYRFRAHWKHRTEETYNVRLFDNRCGCCWKDCVECIWLMDTDKMEYDETFYLHCFGILAKTLRRETGIKEQDVNIIWSKYMFYPIEKSKALDRLSHIRLIYPSSNVHAMKFAEKV